MGIPKLDRKFVWSTVSGGSGRAVEEGADALRWLGRRLAFEGWLENVRRGLTTEAEIHSKSA